MAIHGGPLAGLFQNRLDPDAQADVREALQAHVEAVAAPDGDGISVPAQVVLGLANRPGADRPAPAGLSAPGGGGRPASARRRGRGRRRRARPG